MLKRTNNSSRWNQDAFIANYAHLDLSAARLLAERGVRMVGIDYLSIGRGEEGPEVHRILLAADVVIVVGLDLSGVGPGLYDIVCMPLKILGCDGAPARVAAPAASFARSRRPCRHALARGRPQDLRVRSGDAARRVALADGAADLASARPFSVFCPSAPSPAASRHMIRFSTSPISSDATCGPFPSTSLSKAQTIS